MQEIFPLAAGVVLALLTQRLVAPRVRLPVLVVLAVVAGFCASLVSGELELSWGFVPVDVALVLLAACATYAAPALWHRLAASPRLR